MLPAISSLIRDVFYNILASVFFQIFSVVFASVSSVIAVRIFGINKEKDIKYVEGALSLAKISLAPVLGAKADSVFAYWVAGLIVIDKTQKTTQEMVDALMMFIVKAAFADELTFTENELNSIRKSAEVFVGMMLLKRKATKLAIKRLTNKE